MQHAPNVIRCTNNRSSKFDYDIILLMVESFFEMGRVLHLSILQRTNSLIISSISLAIIPNLILMIVPRAD